ncbi:MAG: hypothetical protein ABI234_03520 [Ktedonobacteraceae bacterium]
MNKLTHVAKVAAALGLLALLLAVNAFTFAPTKASAATTQASTGHSITSVKISNNVHPLCGTAVWWWSSDQTSVSVGNPVTEGFSWQCAGDNTQNWIIDWRDGNTSSFWCFVWQGCTSGSFTGSHTYNLAGTYVAKVYNANNSGIAAWLTITVH